MPGDGEERFAPASYAVQRDPGVRKFTWEELSELNQRHNAHVAVRGKVSGKVNLPSDSRVVCECSSMQRCMM